MIDTAPIYRHVAPAEAMSAPRHRIRNGSAAGDAMSFLIPVTGFLEFDLVGRLFAPEILLLVLLLFLLPTRGRLLLEPLPRTVIILAAAWLLSQVVTDLIRHTPAADYLRGWAKIGFLGLNFAAIYLLTAGSSKRLVLFALGLVVAGILEVTLNPGIYTEGAPWKFGYGAPATMLVVLVAVAMTGRGGKSIVPACLIWAAGFASLLLEFRSMAGICFLAGAYLLARSWLRDRRPGRPVRLRTIAILLILGLAAGWAVLELYAYSAESGLLGHDAQRRYELQSSSGVPLLLAGRSEIFASSRAILDSPVIGHGSWAKDFEYLGVFEDIYASLGLVVDRRMIESGLIPTHSHLLGAWVEAGLLGAVFWLFVAYLIVVAVRATLQANHRLDPLLVFVMTKFGWDILFSPFGATQRYAAAFYITVLISACWTRVDAWRTVDRQRVAA